MRILLVILNTCVMFLSSLVVHADEGDEGFPPYDLKLNIEREHHALQCKVAISVDPARIEIGSKFSVSAHFANSSGAQRSVYNPFFKHLIPFPAKLAIFDAKKKYIGDLLAFEVGSARRIYGTDWMVLPERGIVGARFEIEAGNVARTRYIKNRELPPGIYYLQMIYLDRFLSEMPKHSRSGATPIEQRRWATTEFHRRYPGKELVRSNVVEVRLVAPGGES